jgi:8-oxo-dGTP diphosphatase
VLSVVYWALVDHAAVLSGADLNKVRLVPFEELAAAKPAFDHESIIRHAKRRLDARLATTAVAAHILPKRFTLTQMQGAYEAILGRALDKRNFRKKVEALELVKATGERDRAGSRRPAQLYEMRRDAAEVPQF